MDTKEKVHTVLDTLLDRLERKTKENLRLQRRLGRMAWHRNRRQEAVEGKETEGSRYLIECFEAAGVGTGEHLPSRIKEMRERVETAEASAKAWEKEAHERAENLRHAKVELESVTAKHAALVEQVGEAEAEQDDLRRRLDEADRDVAILAECRRMWPNSVGSAEDILNRKEEEPDATFEPNDWGAEA